VLTSCFSLYCHTSGGIVSNPLSDKFSFPVILKGFWYQDQDQSNNSDSRNVIMYRTFLPDRLFLQSHVPGMQKSLNSWMQDFFVHAAVSFLQIVAPSFLYRRLKWSEKLTTLSTWLILSVQLEDVVGLLQGFISQIHITYSTQSLLSKYFILFVPDFQYHDIIYPFQPPYPMPKEILQKCANLCQILCCNLQHYWSVYNYNSPPIQNIFQSPNQK
jgi:hypothetical protein